MKERHSVIGNHPPAGQYKYNWFPLVRTDAHPNDSNDGDTALCRISSTCECTVVAICIHIISASGFHWPVERGKVWCGLQTCIALDDNNALEGVNVRTHI